MGEASAEAPSTARMERLDLVLTSSRQGKRGGNAQLSFSKKKASKMPLSAQGLYGPFHGNGGEKEGIGKRQLRKKDLVKEVEVRRDLLGPP